MKIKLTPELAYLIGFWRQRRSGEGLGICGPQKYLELFAKEALGMEMTTPEKLLTAGDCVYFYHTAYRRFFLEVEKDELERFKYLNEYAGNYLAGMFDASGEIDDRGYVYISRANQQDEMLLLRLGFQTKRAKQRLIIGKPRAFLAFIKNYVKLTKDNPVFGLVANHHGKKDEKHGNEAAER